MQIIRIFSVLKKEDLITAKGKKIGINNLQALKNEISEHNYYLDS
jgi:hypothetical protein